ncbi:MAG: iron-containing redox enzyme family protein [Acidobacteriota bacterium]|nr:iron-containing redox enzyme family protein [Acidobacteriota bacterium]
MKTILDDTLKLILAHRSVQHPFLLHYAENGLTPRQERTLFSECYYFFRHLPFYVAGMANNTRDEMILRELLINVMDEIGDGDKIKVTHSQIYMDFLTKIGVSEEEVQAYKPLAVTTALNEGIRKLYVESDIRKALGALYVDETMSGIMVSKLNDGLEHRWDKDTRYFFLLHIDVEVGHSNGIFNALHGLLEKEDTQRLFEEGMEGFLTLLEAFWDGVQELVMSMEPATAG